MGLKVVPDPEPVVPGPVNLSSQIDGLTRLVDEAINGGDVENADGLAKLVNALARLIDSQTKSRDVVTKADLAQFVSRMIESINTHVGAYATPREAISHIERDWRRAMIEVAG